MFEVTEEELEILLNSDEYKETREFLEKLYRGDHLKDGRFLEGI